MLGRRSREFPSHKTEAAGFAAKATDLDALRNAVVDAAGVGYGLWFSYLFALLYFAIAAGAVTHRDLLLESPVKLPFLNVELPLKAFFILGPLVFLVVHAYVLLHFLLLAGKVGTFHAELQKQVAEDEKRAQLRRQLPSNIFVQFLAGPREVRTGIVGLLLKSVATISLVAGPIALLVLFQLQFLPYHNPSITWWQRVAVFLDLILLWLLWPPIVRGGETDLLSWSDLGRVKVAGWLLASLLPLLLVFTIATFPGEWLEEALPEVRLVPTTLAAWRLLPSVEAIQKAGSGWATMHELLVAGRVDFVTGKPQNWWSNVLVLPNFDIGDRVKFDAGGKIVLSPEAVSLRGRQLEGAVFVDAHLKKADFTGAELVRANFSRADLREAKFNRAQLQGAFIIDAQLQGAVLQGAQLQGAVLQGAQLQGASLVVAQLQGASLSNARLQGASLERAQLQGAVFGNAELQGASLNDAQLQGASILDMELQGASLRDAFVWRTRPPLKIYLESAWIVGPEPKPKYSGLDCVSGKTCDWSDQAYAALKTLIEARPAHSFALEWIKQLGEKPYEEDPGSAKAWRDLAAESQLSAKAYPGELAKRLIRIGCAANEAPYVVGGLIEQLDVRFQRNSAQSAEVARAFLDEANCPGAQGLSEEKKSKLRQILGPTSPGPGPGTASR
jgi:Pentapeptide repeats (8 copies)